MLLNRFFGPAPLVGIDVGTCSVKVVEAQIDSRGRVRVLRHGESLTPAGCYVGGQVEDSPKLGLAIREALRSAGIAGRKAVLAVPSQVGFVRKLAFPTMPLRELRAAIDLQPDRYIPFAREGAVYDVSVLPGEAGDGQIWAVVAAAPARCSAALMEACRHAGVATRRIDLEPLALHRAAVALKLVGPSMGSSIVDLGVNVAKISLFEGDVPVISRVLDMPRPDLPDSPDPFAGVETETLFWDIRRSLEFALTQTKTPPERVLITGGASSDGYLAISMAAYLRGFLAARLPADFQVLPFTSDMIDLPFSHMLALGLALDPGQVSA